MLSAFIHFRKEHGIFLFPKSSDKVCLLIKKSKRYAKPEECNLIPAMKLNGERKLISGYLIKVIIFLNMMLIFH